MKDISLGQLKDAFKEMVSEEIHIASHSKAGKGCKRITYVPESKLFYVRYTKSEDVTVTDSIETAYDAYININL